MCCNSKGLNLTAWGLFTAVSDENGVMTTVNKPHVVEFHPVEVHHTSGAAHIRAARQYEHQSVQQYQATHLSDDRVATPDRKRRKQRHTASPAAGSAPITAAAATTAGMVRGSSDAHLIAADDSSYALQALYSMSWLWFCSQTALLFAMLSLCCADVM